MKTSKKLLIICFGIGIVGMVAGIFAWCFTAFGISFWPVFVLIFLLQIIGKSVFDRYVEYNFLRNSIEEYTKKPYKEFIVPLTCQICGKTDNVSMDLSETEYRCTSCKRMNAIYVTFATAALGIETTSAK